MIPKIFAAAAPKRIYFDHNATTAVATQCVEAINACLRLGPLNPSSKHSLGDQAKRVVLGCAAGGVRGFGASPAEIVFTSGGTESNHLAILGALAAPRPAPHREQRGRTSLDAAPAASPRDPRACT
jgi:cysteine desulfurase